MIELNLIYISYLILYKLYWLSLYNTNSMAKIIFILAAVIFAVSAFSLSDISEMLNVRSQMEGIKQMNPFIKNTDCTKQLAAECALDIERTVKACAAAFESEGANIIADIKCAKDLMADKKHCWPCICYEAQQKGWKIIGC